MWLPASGNPSIRVRGASAGEEGSQGHGAIRLAAAALHFALEDVGDNIVSEQVVAVVVLAGCGAVALLDL